ncbi:hypothetical protein QFZ71_004276 [Streptomyces sp. V2I9]|nr:hypothetical protein [Streptomyces sp. V2I9]
MTVEELGPVVIALRQERKLASGCHTLRGARRRSRQDAGRQDSVDLGGESRPQDAFVARDGFGGRGATDQVRPYIRAAADALLGHLAAQPSTEWLFTMEEGEPFNYRRWKTEWNGARKPLQAAENETAGREGRKPVELPHLVATRPPSSRCGSTRTCGRAKKTAPGP